jgi:hypothetical protein
MAKPLDARLGAFGSLIDRYLGQWRKVASSNRDQRIVLEALLSDSVGCRPKHSTQMQKLGRKKRRIEGKDGEILSEASVKSTLEHGSDGLGAVLQPPTRARSPYEMFKVKAAHQYPLHIGAEQLEYCLQTRWMQLRLRDKMVERDSLISECC